MFLQANPSRINFIYSCLINNMSNLLADSPSHGNQPSSKPFKGVLSIRVSPLHSKTPPLFWQRQIELQAGLFYLIRLKSNSSLSFQIAVLKFQCLFNISFICLKQVLCLFSCACPVGILQTSNAMQTISTKNRNEWSPYEALTVVLVLLRF